MTESNQIGYYGKIPSYGDFISRRLPRQFISPWDKWLQNVLTCSRAQLNEVWLETYLTSPIWRFILSPGLCGTQAWSGAVMPSVDKVGRYFPFTVVLPLTDAMNPFCIAKQTDEWFKQAEALLLSSLEEENFDLNEFDQALLALGSVFPIEPDETADLADVDGSGNTKNYGWHFSLSTASNVVDSYAETLWQLMQRKFSAYSLWWTEGSERVQPSFLVAEGLPAVEGYAAFLDGQWPNRSWQSTDVSRQPIVESQGVEEAEPPMGVGLVPTIINTTSKSKDDTADITIPKYTLLSTEASHTGNSSRINEDALFVSSDQGIWVVADGMGGHEAGDFASQSIVQQLENITRPDSLEQYIDIVCTLLQDTNRFLQEESTRRENRTLGSTVVVFLVLGNRAACLWAGDSRIYLFRNSVLKQITKDHSVVEAMVTNGLLQPNEAESNPQANVITRAVGAHETLDLDVEFITLEENDRVILCSDGLYKELSETEIVKTIQDNIKADVASALLQATLAKEAKDNVTIIAVEVKAVEVKKHSDNLPDSENTKEL